MRRPEAGDQQLVKRLRSFHFARGRERRERACISLGQFNKRDVALSINLSQVIPGLARLLHRHLVIVRNANVGFVDIEDGSSSNRLQIIRTDYDLKLDISRCIIWEETSPEHIQIVHAMSCRQHPILRDGTTATEMDTFLRVRLVKPQAANARPVVGVSGRPVDDLLAKANGLPLRCRAPNRRGRRTLSVRNRQMPDKQTRYGKGNSRAAEK